MKLAFFSPTLITAIFLGACSVNANSITPDEKSPNLSDPGFCAAPLPAYNNRIWSGELPQWSGSGRPLVKVELGNGAVCNDGSPAAIFVRPAPPTLPNGRDNPERHTYHIHLKGGGSCRSFSDCQERYCGTGGAQLDRPGLMSSRGWRRLIEGEGLFADRPQNRFAAANQVLAGYCSSDTWIGSAPAGTAISTDPTIPAATEQAAVSNIAFMGEVIVSEILNELDSGVSVSNQRADVEYQMPSLTTANRILITGDSGGANGARHHIDRISARYQDARVVAALDASGAIDRADASLDYSQIGYSDYQSMLDNSYAQVVSFFGTNTSALDESCVMAGKVPNCIDGYVLSRDHISTETLLRFSLGDIQSVKSTGKLMTPPTTKSDAAEQTRLLSHDGLNAITAANPMMSAIGPNCARHVTFRNNQQVSQMETLAGGPNLYTELRTWVDSCFTGPGCAQHVNIAPLITPTASTCP